MTWYNISMPLKITTWNINSVRLRIDMVAKFLKSGRPDVLCLQETKCPDDAFPLKRFQRLGYKHAALNRQKGYHGAAGPSRLPPCFGNAGRAGALTRSNPAA